jgi:hypothetical protein
MAGLAVVLVVGGCASDTSGSPGPSSAGTTSPTALAPTSRTAPTPTTASDGALGFIDPCSLLDPAVVARNGMHNAGAETSLGARSCSWDRNADATGGGFSIAINIYDQAGLDQLNTINFTVTNYPIGRHQGRLNKETAGDTCSVSIGVTAMSRVDIVGVPPPGQGPSVGCQLAELAAPSIEQKLPVEG